MGFRGGVLDVGVGDGEDFSMGKKLMFFLGGGGFFIFFWVDDDY